MPADSSALVDEVRVPADVVDLASFRRWAASDSFPERGKISFLGGEVEVDMSPENINAHNTVRGCLTIALGLLADEEGSGQVFPDGALVINVDAELANEPDLVFVRFDSLESGRVTIGEPGEDPNRAIELIGSPDLVVEVVSPSSVRKDKRDLRERYFRAGVQEYWLIDARREPLSFEILIPADHGFEPAPTDAEGYACSSLWNRRFRLIRQPHHTGLVRYRLESAATAR